MKRKITAAIVLLCVVASCFLPLGKAAGTVYFSVINETILPLNDATMPRYFDGKLYLPYSFFNSYELGVYSSGGDNLAIVYNAVKTLNFDVPKGTIIDQAGIQYYEYSARAYNGVVYVPAKFVCDFFGFMPPTVIKAVPADIIRVRTATSVINDLTYPNIEYIKTQLQAAYDKYKGIPPSSSSSPTPSDDIEPKYADVTVYLSFFELSAGELESILEKLASTAYKACFFVAADEIEANADLLRRAAGKGHTIGIWLNENTKELASKEYQEASALLFEATQVKTVIVTALGGNITAAEEMAKQKSLVFWRPTRSYDAEAKFTVAGLTGKLSTLGVTRDSLYFACSEETSIVLRSFLAYLSQYEYSVRRITETSVPVMTA